MAEVIVKAADGGGLSAYLAASKKGKGPGVLVIQEVFGVNQVMRDICDGFAAQGYTAICPDLFWRQEPHIDITDKTKAEWDKAMARMQGMDQDKAVEDLKATLATLRQHPGCSGRAGAVGYCLGGRLAYMMATRSDANCSVSYYGVMLDSLLGKSRGIQESAAHAHRREGSIRAAAGPDQDQGGVAHQFQGHHVHLQGGRPRLRPHGRR